MATRAKLYRCTLCSALFGAPGPQTEGFRAVWTQNFNPIVDRVIHNGEMVELFVTLPDTEAVGPGTPVRFDIIEEDFFLTGLDDDLVVSILADDTSPGKEKFPKTQRRLTRRVQIWPTDTPERAVARFIEQHPADYADYLLVLEDSVQSGELHLVTWWRAEYVDDVVGKAEYYFIVNFRNEVESQSLETIDVAREPGARVVAVGFQDGIGETETLPPLDLAATAEPAFRELAGQIVRESVLYAEYEREVAVAAAEPGSGGAATVPSLPAGRRASVQAGPPQIVDEPLPDDQEPDPYGTGWTFWHADEREHPERDQFVQDMTPWDEVVLYLLNDAAWTTIAARGAGRGYYISYDLTRAVRWGKTLMAPYGFAILEHPMIEIKKPLPRRADGDIDWSNAPHYLVVPLAKPIAWSQLRKVTYRDADLNPVKESVPVRWSNFFPRTLAPTSDFCALRAIGTTDDYIAYFDAEAPIKRELFRQLEEGGFYTQISEPFANLLHKAAFSAVEVAEAAQDAAARQAALLKLDHNAFALLTPDRRREHLSFLLGRFGWLTNAQLDAAILQIFKAIKDKDELEKIRDRVGKDAMERLVLNHSGIWGLLSMLGKKLEKELPKTSFGDFVLLLLQLTAFGTASQDKTKQATGLATRLILGPAGMSFSPDVLTEIRQGALSLVKFAEGTVVGIYELVTHPQQIVDAVGQLMNLIMTLEMARVVLPTLPGPQPEWLIKAHKEQARAQKKLKDMFEGALKSLLAGSAAAELLSQGQEKDVRDTLLMRVKWTLLWEVLSMFVGIGELKAVVNFGRAALEAASFAGLLSKLKTGQKGAEAFRLFAKALSRESRILKTEEQAAQAFSHLPDPMVHDIERGLQGVDTVGAQTMEQIIAHSGDNASLVTKGGKAGEAMGLLIQKSRGVVSSAADQAFARLARAGVNESELLAMMQALPHGEGRRFIEAINILPEAALSGGYANPEFFRNLASHQSWVDLILKDEAAFRSIYRHAGADAKKVDTMIAAIDDLAWELAHSEAQLTSALKDIANGDATRLAKLAEAKPARPSAPKAREVPHGEPPKPPTPRPNRPPPEPPPGMNEQVYDLFNARFDPQTGDFLPGGSDFYNGFDPSMRTAVDRMTDAVAGEPGLFRSLVTEIDEATYAERKAKLVKQMIREGRQAEVGDLERALDKLNTEFRTRVAERTSRLTPQAIAGRMKDVHRYLEAAAIKKREIEQRIAEYSRRAANSALDEAERARAAERVKRLTREKAELESWMADNGARQKELDALAEAVNGSDYLKDRLANGSADDMLYRLWADMKFRPTGRPPVKSPFSKYVSRRMGEYRGLSGELDKAFTLGGEFDLLKASDGFVTRRGIDAIAQRRIDRMLAILDNKSGFGKTVTSVSALTKNLVHNLLEDAAEFRRLAQRFPDASHDLLDAANRMENAATRMQGVLADVPAGDALTLAKQEALADILRDNNMQLLVTNFGGQAAELGPALGKHIQFWDVAEVGKGPLQVGKLPPAPPPP